MSEAFFKTTLDLAVRLIVTLVCILIGSQLVFFYVIYHYLLFYVAYLLVLYSIFWYSTKTYADYKHFSEVLSQGLMFPQPKQDMETLQISPEELDDKGLKACLLYHQGIGYKEIGQIMVTGKEHSQTVRRLIRRGLKILIEDYKKHNHTDSPEEGIRTPFQIRAK